MGFAGPTMGVTMIRLGLLDLHFVFFRNRATGMMRNMNVTNGTNSQKLRGRSSEFIWDVLSLQ